MRTKLKAALVAFAGVAATVVATTPAAAFPSCQLCVVITDGVRSEYRASSIDPPVLDLGRMTFQIQSNVLHNVPMTVPWQLQLIGSANAADLDTSTYSGVATIAVGESRTSVSIPITQDTVSEYNETFLMHIGDPSGNYYAEDDTAVGTILDDDPARVSTINAPRVRESGDLVYSIRLSRPVTSTVTVTYTTRDGSATVDDYYPTSGTVVFTPGQTSKVITVQLKDDNVVNEPDETVWLKLTGITSVAGVPIADASATGTIVDNDFIG